MKTPTMKIPTVKTPDYYLKEWYQRKPAAAKAAFFAAIIFGLVTHLYQFTNKLYNYDELANTPGGNGASIEQGRWFLKWMGDRLLRYFGGVYSLPLLNGIISVILLAVSAALVVTMFRVDSKVLAAMIGGLMVSFPSIVCMFFYMFTAVFYAVGILLSVLAAYLVICYPKNIIAHCAAAFALACSLGVYQAYFPNTVCLLIISVILLSAFGDEKDDWKTVFFTAIRYISVLAAGMILYFIINRLVLSAANVEMINYQGGASMGQITFLQFARAVKRCYRDFLGLTHENVLVLNATGVLRSGFFFIMLLFAVSAAFLFFGKKGDWIKKIFMVFGFLIFPAALFMVYIMAPEAQAYTLMGYAVVFFLVFFAVWTDCFYRNSNGAAWAKTGMQWLAEIVSVLLLVTYIWYGNGCYMSLEYTKGHDMAYFQTMITQIKSIDGYEDELPVAFIGNNIEDQTNRMGSLMGSTFSINGKDESNVNAFSRIHIITEYLGFAPTICGYEETKACMENEKVKEMSSYPDDGSIQIVDGVIVVKFSDYE